MARDIDGRVHNYALRMVSVVEGSSTGAMNELLRWSAAAGAACRILFLALCPFILITQPLCAQATPFGPHDMQRVSTFAEGSEPALSPAADWVAYAVVDVDNESNILARHPTAFLYVVKSDGSATRRLPNSQDHADTPAWSPDGSKLAFLGTRDGQRQALLWDAASGQVRELGEPFASDR